jgi:hypothetical protein
MKRLEKIEMKKLLFFFLLAVTVVSCSVSDEPDSREFMLPVESASVPETLIAGQVNTILVRYRRPTDCHIFNGFYIDSNGYGQTISVRSLKFTEAGCMDDSAVLYEAPLNFTPNVEGTYYFKFWTGNDTDGSPVYLEFESVVE